MRFLCRCDCISIALSSFKHHIAGHVIQAAASFEDLCTWSDVRASQQGFQYVG